MAPGQDIYGHQDRMCRRPNVCGLAGQNIYGAMVIKSREVGRKRACIQYESPVSRTKAMYPE
jgi:hypothetical protein